MGRLAMIMSMPVGKFVCRSIGVVCVMSSGKRLFQWAVDEGGTLVTVLRLKRPTYVLNPEIASETTS